jgi:hypothetical protein
MRRILTSKKSIQAGKDGHFKNIGQLIQIIHDAEDKEAIDGREIKDYYQTVQLLDMLVLMMVFTGNMLCMLSVNFKFLADFNFRLV